ncbi:MAG TPA: FIST N-terminal domain-containing protein, partial [Patescibacteria group bacterium]|nr:FIST N-terminal domain-containing protein [Patescibacteria group bacterium]
MKKNKIWIIVILLSVLALSLVVVLLKFLEIENKSAYVIKQNGVSESESEKIKVASGWSVNEDSKKAVDEAMYSIRLGLNGQSPDFLIVQATEGIDYSTVIGEIHTVWPSVQIFGGTSHLATLTDDGYHQGESGSLSLLGVVSEKIEFAVGGSSFADYSSPEKAVEEAIGLATADFSEEKPELVFMTSAPGFEEKVLLEIKKILGPDVPVFGGSS